MNLTSKERKVLKEHWGQPLRIRGFDVELKKGDSWGVLCSVEKAKKDAQLLIGKQEKKTDERVSPASVKANATLVSKPFFVCVTGFTKEGLPKYSMNPTQWTTSLEQAYKWEKRAFAKEDIASLQKIYGVKGQLLEVKKDA